MLFCLNDDSIKKKHQSHNIITYKNLIDSANDQNKKLQFRTYESFSQYVNKVEKTFEKQFDDNLAKTIKSFEEFMKIIEATLEEYKKDGNKK